MSAIKNAVQVTKTIAKQSATAAAATALIGLKVDGHPVKVAKGATMLDAINKSGSHVPTLCFHPEFKPKAVCEFTVSMIFRNECKVSSFLILSTNNNVAGRICLVDVKGENKPVPACRTMAQEGQDIVTNSEELKSFRRRYVP